MILCHVLNASSFIIRVKKHLVLDLLGRVCQEDGGVGVAGAHLGLSALKRREERGVKQSGFKIADPRSHIPRHPEIWILRDRGSCDVQ